MWTGAVAQRLEQHSYKVLVVGSIPTRPTFLQFMLTRHESYV